MEQRARIEQLEPSFTQLRNGFWGVTLPGTDRQRGEIVDVRTRKGKVIKVRVGRIIWRGNGRTLARCYRTWAGPGERGYVGGATSSARS